MPHNKAKHTLRLRLHYKAARVGGVIRQGNRKLMYDFMMGLVFFTTGAVLLCQLYLLVRPPRGLLGVFIKVMVFGFWCAGLQFSLGEWFSGIYCESNCANSNEAAVIDSLSLIALVNIIVLSISVAITLVASGSKSVQQGAVVDKPLAWLGR